MVICFTYMILEMSKKILLIRISGNYGASETKRKLIDIQSNMMTGIMGRKMLLRQDILELNLTEAGRPPYPPKPSSLKAHEGLGWGRKCTRVLSSSLYMRGYWIEYYINAFGVDPRVYTTNLRYCLRSCSILRSFEINETFCRSYSHRWKVGRNSL
mgnify:CR=1 FL=1